MPLLQQYHNASNINILLCTQKTRATEMRKYILTDNERHIIKRYLKKGEKLDGYRTLLVRCRRKENIQEDLQLINQLLEKADKG
ncbi:MAG: hypothetical protein ACLQO7_00485 [Candidatus Bathyarchaeia archaeon]